MKDADSLQITTPSSWTTTHLVRSAQRALDLRDYVQGLAFADSAIAQAPLAPDGHFVQGLIFFEWGRMDEALASWHEVQRMQPDYPGLAHNLGNVAFQQRRYRDALVLYTRETGQSGDPDPWHALGTTYEVLGRASEARDAYMRAVAVDSGYAPAYAALADWHEREGEVRAALAHARDALALDSVHVAYRYRVGALLHRTGEPAAAIPHLRAVLDAQPWNYRAAFSLGQSLRDMGRKDEAEAVLARAVRLQAEQQDVERHGREARTRSESVRAQWAYADALRRTGRLAEALHAYHVALGLRPEDLTLQTNVATLHAQAGRYDEAEAWFYRILQADSTHAEAWVNLGLLYLSTGRRARADTAWHRAFRYGEGNPAVEAFRERFQ